MKKFYVGVKGIVHDNRGYLLLRSAKGYWDIPGGRIDGEETIEQTLRRELSEELPSITVQSITSLQGAFRMPKDIEEDTGLVLLYYLVEAKLPEQVILSEEHENILWGADIESIPDDLNPTIDAILRTLLASDK